MQKAEYPNVTFRDVLRAMWRGVRPDKWTFWYLIFAFLAADIIRIFIPLFYKDFFDLIAKATDRGAVVEELGYIVMMFGLLNFTAWVIFRSAMFFCNRLEVDVMARLRQICFNYLMYHSYGFFANNFTGSLVQRVNRFARSFERLFDTLVFNTISLAVTIIGSIVITWLTERTFAYIILAWIAVFLTFNFLFSRWKLKYDIKVAEADTRTTGVLADAITNQNSVALFTAGREESGRFRDITEEQAKTTLFSWNLAAIVDAVQVGLIYLVEFCIFFYGIYLWQQGEASIGTFVLVQVYVIQLAHRLWDFGRIMRNTYESFADSKEMVQILALPHEIRDIPAATELSVSQGEIIFKDLLFSFQKTRVVLNGINLTINGGEKVALVGPSGAGKTTLVRLLLRLHDVTGGKILVDDQDVSKVTQESLRSNVALVPQDPVLFHRSLIENIRYGRPDASDAEVQEAARLAHCDEFIDTLPLRYETLVGERGIKLSGGERQRIAIARAILKNAPILILDEATSSLDSHSESLIQDALDTLMRGKTSIVVAHRLSTIRKMDRIIVLEQGQIREEGTHESLLKDEKSLYRHLWELQAGGFIGEAA